MVFKKQAYPYMMRLSEQVYSSHAVTKIYSGRFHGWEDSC